MKRDYERCPYWSRTLIARLRYYRIPMKYIGYIAFWVSSLTYAKNLVAIDGNKTGLPSPSNISNITSSMKTIIGILQDITAIVAVIGICIVGIMYIMSHGSEEKTEAAKKYMITILI